MILKTEIRALERKIVRLKDECFLLNSRCRGHSTNDYNTGECFRELCQAIAALRWRGGVEGTGDDVR